MTQIDCTIFYLNFKKSFRQRFQTSLAVPTIPTFFQKLDMFLTLILMLMMKMTISR